MFQHKDSRNHIIFRQYLYCNIFFFDFVNTSFDFNMFSKDYRNHYKINIKLAYPIIIGQVGHIMTGIADSIMVGQVGSEYLAAASFAHNIFIMFFVFGVGVSTGLTPLVGVAKGQNNSRECGRLLSNGTILGIFAGMALTAIILAVYPFLKYMGQTDVVLQLAQPYYIITAFSMFPGMLFLTFKQFTEGLSLTKPAMFFSISGNLLNIVLNYFLIYGVWIFPRLELDGAGYATLIARLYMGLAFGYYVFSNTLFKGYIKHFGDKLISRKRIIAILKLGIPIGFQLILEIASFSFGAIMIGWLGAYPLAAHQIAISLAATTYLAAGGLASAATIRLSTLIGAGKFEEMRRAGFSTFLMAAMFMFVTAILFILLRNYLPLIFVNEREVIELASGLIIIASLFQMFDGTQVVGLGALRGLKDVKIPTLTALMAYWCVGIPTGYTLAFVFGYGAYGVWIGYLVGLGTAAVLLFFRFVKVSREVV